MPTAITCSCLPDGQAPFSTQTIRCFNERFADEVFLCGNVYGHEFPVMRWFEDRFEARFVQALASLGRRFSNQSGIYMHDHIRIVYPSEHDLKSIGSRYLIGVKSQFANLLHRFCLVEINSRRFRSHIDGRHGLQRLEVDDLNRARF